MTQQNINSDLLVRLSHMRLWIVLVTIVYVGSAMLLILLAGPGVREVARSALIMLPIAQGLAFGALRMKGGKANCVSSPQMRAVMNDELRQQAVSKGYRNGFFAALVATVASALFVSVARVEWAPAVMMVVVATLGVAVMLGSVLYYDR